MAPSSTSLQRISCTYLLGTLKPALNFHQANPSGSARPGKKPVLAGRNLGAYYFSIGLSELSISFNPDTPLLFTYYRANCDGQNWNPLYSL